MFESLCSIQCTQAEICSVLDVDDVTLNSWCKRTYKKRIKDEETGKYKLVPMSFSEVFSIKREGGKASLRRKQWLLADHNAAMAIFLGKQYLGQTDKIEQEVEVKNNGLYEAIANLSLGRSENIEEK